jgi:hypothetical protein
MFLSKRMGVTPFSPKTSFSCGKEPIIASMIQGLVMAIGECVDIDDDGVTVTVTREDETEWSLTRDRGRQIQHSCAIYSSTGSERAVWRVAPIPAGDSVQRFDEWDQVLRHALSIR